MRFEVLGPLRILAGSATVALTARRERILLAMLLLRVGESVPVDRLVEAVWADRPPQDVTGQLQSSVYRLRKALAAAGMPDVISTEPGGYRLEVDPQTVDLIEFQRLRDAGRAAADGGDNDAATRQYRAALQRWRGPALAGIDSAEVRRAAAALDEERVQAQQECIEVELVLGRASELVAELTGLVEEHPYREGLHAALMRALYQTGRQADALAAFRRVRQLLHDELGTEPGAELQRLHQAILSRDPELDLPTSAVARIQPRELPADVAGFTGRGDALAALDGMLGEPAAPVVISAIAGTAGVGKTALAVNWAHRVAEQFPDGQLYINLRGYAIGSPLRPIDALAALLRSLGVPPERIPTDEAQAAGLYRSQLAGKRTLVVLDNAGSVDQVRPLLPGSAGCLVLVTSRDRLTGLVARDGARRITLDVLPPDDARALLAHLLGTDRVNAEPDAADALARACAYLPLALRVATANLLDHPQRAIAAYVADLTSGDRLTMLQADGDEESAVRATFDLSYRRLPADAQRLFRLLGLVPGPDVTPPAAAALTGTTVDNVEPLLAKLATAHLLDEHAPGRYTFHDLLRLHARQLAQLEDPGRPNGAVARLQTYYLLATCSAVQWLYPQMARLPPTIEGKKGVPPTEFDNPAESLAWLDAERPNLVAAIQQAATDGPVPLAWLLTDQLRGYFLRRRHTIEWRVTADAALDAANSRGSAAVQAAVHLSLADLCRVTGKYEEAIEHATNASALARSAGWTEAEAAALGGLGGVHWWLGLLPQAVEHFTQALDLNHKAGRRLGQAGNSLYLGILDQELGRLHAGVDRTLTALALYRQANSTNGEADALNSLGTAFQRLGRLSDAHTHLVQALVLYESTGDRGGMAGTLDSLASVHHDVGRLAEALDCARSAVMTAVDIGDRRIEASALNAVARVEIRLGNCPQAVLSHLQAADLARHANALYVEIEALIGVSIGRLYQGEGLLAQKDARKALGLARQAGYRVLTGKALEVIANLHARQGAHVLAHRYACRVLREHRSTGHRPGEARVFVILGRIAQSTGQTQKAQRHWQEARELFEEMGAVPPEDLPGVIGGGRG